ncbi:Eukaryotic initiation factor 4A-I [Haplosporangium sp. Z 27]|nr:Eukaryotic initiation factor 4A-I [Haplosporangium sp. Z 27]
MSEPATKTITVAYDSASQASNSHPSQKQPQQKNEKKNKNNASTEANGGDSKANATNPTNKVNVTSTNGSNANNTSPTSSTSTRPGPSSNPNSPKVSKSKRNNNASSKGGVATPKSPTLRDPDHNEGKKPSGETAPSNTTTASVPQKESNDNANQLKSGSTGTVGLGLVSGNDTKSEHPGRKGGFGKSNNDRQGNSSKGGFGNRGDGVGGDEENSRGRRSDRKPNRSDATGAAPSSTTTTTTTTTTKTDSTTTDNANAPKPEGQASRDTGAQQQPESQGVNDVKKSKNATTKSSHSPRRERGVETKNSAPVKGASQSPRPKKDNVSAQNVTQKQEPTDSAASTTPSTPATSSTEPPKKRKPLKKTNRKKDDDEVSTVSTGSARDAEASTDDKESKKKKNYNAKNDNATNQPNVNVQGSSNVGSGSSTWEPKPKVNRSNHPQQQSHGSTNDSGSSKNFSGPRNKKDDGSYNSKGSHKNQNNAADSRRPKQEDSSWAETAPLDKAKSSDDNNVVTPVQDGWGDPPKVVAVDSWGEPPSNQDLKWGDVPPIPSSGGGGGWGETPETVSGGGWDEKPAKSSGGGWDEKPAKSSGGGWDEKPAKSSGSSWNEKPARNSGGSWGERPARNNNGGWGDKSAKPAKSNNASWGDRPSKPHSGNWGDKPAKPNSGNWGDKPAKPNSGNWGERPVRNSGAGRSEETAKATGGGWDEKPARSNGGGWGERQAKSNNDGWNEKPAKSKHDGWGEKTTKTGGAGKGDGPSKASSGGKAKEPAQHSSEKSEETATASNGGWGEKSVNASNVEKDKEPEKASSGGWNEEPVKSSGGGWDEEPAKTTGGGWNEEPAKDSGGGWSDEPTKANGGDGSGWGEPPQSGGEGWGEVTGAVPKWGEDIPWDSPSQPKPFSNPDWEKDDNSYKPNRGPSESYQARAGGGRGKPLGDSESRFNSSRGGFQKGGRRPQGSDNDFPKDARSSLDARNTRLGAQRGSHQGANKAFPENTSATNGPSDSSTSAGESSSQVRKDGAGADTTSERRENSFENRRQQAFSDVRLDPHYSNRQNGPHTGQRGTAFSTQHRHDNQSSGLVSSDAHQNGPPAKNKFDQSGQNRKGPKEKNLREKPEKRYVPLFSDSLECQTTWKEMNLSPNVLASIEKAGLEKPSNIQKLIMKPFEQGRDVIAQAQSQNDRTNTLAIALLQKLSATASTQKHCQALVICSEGINPQKVHEDFEEWFKSTPGLRSILLSADMVADKTLLSDPEQPKQVILTTLGPLMEAVNTKVLDMKTIGIVVISMRSVELVGFEAFKKFWANLSRDAQVILMTGRIQPQIQMIKTQNFRANAAVRRADELTMQWSEHYYISIPPSEQKAQLENSDDNDADQDSKPAPVDRKWETLMAILTNNPDISHSLILTQSQSMTQALTTKLKERNLPVLSVWSMADKTEVARQFNKPDPCILVSESVLMDNLDLDYSSLVINYEMPRKASHYISSFGPFGRSGLRALVINFYTTDDAVQKQTLADMESIYDIKIQEMQVWTGLSMIL